jgi:predicted transcriptional regulator
MKVKSYWLPADIIARVDSIARETERSRSYVVRDLLERALAGAARLDRIAGRSQKGDR